MNVIFGRISAAVYIFKEFQKKNSNIKKCSIFNKIENFIELDQGQIVRFILEEAHYR